MTPHLQCHPEFTAVYGLNQNYDLAYLLEGRCTTKNIRGYCSKKNDYLLHSKEKTVVAWNQYTILTKKRNAHSIKDITDCWMFFLL